MENVGNAVITINGNTIAVDKTEDALVTIYSTNGHEIYRGYDNRIQVAAGLYIVTVTANGNTTITKLSVK